MAWRNLLSSRLPASGEGLSPAFRPQAAPAATTVLGQDGAFDGPFPRKAPKVLAMKARLLQEDAERFNRE
jgi:hypothetical protein